MNPLVSIGIPAYNGAQFLRECLDSILAQTFEDFEVNLIDDCSTDETVAIASAYCKRDPRITVHLNPVRLGLVGNFNRCVALARGKYVCIFGQDDVMLPENIGLKLELLENNPAVGFVHSNIFRIHDHGKVFAEHWAAESTENYIQTGHHLMSKLLIGSNSICCPSVLARKSCLDHVGAFDDRLFFTCDWEMWMRLCAGYDVACLGRPLVKFRRHSDTESSRVGGSLLELEQELLAKRILIARLRDYRHPGASEMPTGWNALASRALGIARKAFYRDDFDNFRQCLLFAIRLQPKLLSQSECLNLVTRALLGRRLISAYRSIMSTMAR
jgi:glycosyltransferase involved in cell wall biosynthesis